MILRNDIRSLEGAGALGETAATDVLREQVATEQVKTLRANRTWAAVSGVSAAVVALMWVVTTLQRRGKK